jgi:hypothetical protein
MGRAIGVIGGGIDHTDNIINAAQRYYSAGVA